MKKILSFLALLGPVLLHSQTTLTLTPSEDASIGYHDGTTTAANNYGNAVQLAAYAIPSVAQTGGLNVNRGLLKFDLSSLPPGAIVVNAVLDLYAFGPIGVYNGHTGANNSALERVTTNWSEMAVTWLNQPQTTQVNRVLLPSSTNPNQDYLNLNVTSLVQDIRNSGINYGFMLKLVNEFSTNILAFCSQDHSDASRHPRLKIDYTMPQSITESISTPALHVVCYPNPANTSDALNMSLTTSVNETANISILNSLGQTVLDTKLMISPQIESYQLPTNPLSPGIYMLSVQAGKSAQTIKFIVQ